MTTIVRPDLVPNHHVDELWAPIKGYEGHYEISTDGRVRSIDRVTKDRNGHNRRRAGRLLSQQINQNGYPTVGLKLEGQRRSFLVHRLVALTFIPNDNPDADQVCHNDGDPANAHVENLRWDTKSGNELDKNAHGTMHQRKRTHCPHGHPLEAPNLALFAVRRGHRVCRACNGARAAVRLNPSRDFQQVADAYLAGYLKAAAS